MLRNESNVRTVSRAFAPFALSRGLLEPSREVRQQAEAQERARAERRRRGVG